MQNSIFIAQIVGPTMAVVGLALVLHRNDYVQAAREMLDSRAHLIMAGMLALVLGLVLVNTHNDWAFGWPLIITILGWMSLVAGVFRLLLPDQVRAMGEKMIGDGPVMTIAGVAYIVLGAILSYYAYFV